MILTGVNDAECAPPRRRVEVALTKRLAFHCEERYKMYSVFRFFLDASVWPAITNGRPSCTCLVINHHGHK